MGMTNQEVLGNFQPFMSRVRPKAEDMSQKALRRYLDLTEVTRKDWLSLDLCDDGAWIAFFGELRQLAMREVGDI